MNKHQDIHLIVIKLSLDGIMINITNGVAFTEKKTNSNDYKEKTNS